MRFMVVPCDGIGPEITAATLQVLETANGKFGLGLELDFEEAGFPSLEKYGTTLRNEVLERARGYDGIILGPQSHMDYPSPEHGGRNVSAGFRVGLDLYANVRPAYSRPYLEKGAEGMDLVIMREATEGFYPDRNMHRGIGEFMPTPEIALSVRKITAPACERIAHAAFRLAMRRNKHVTAVHKANNFLMTDGLFLEQVRKVATDYPDVRLDDVIVDAMAAQIVRDPSRYDVIVTTNFYADILSDLASELSGSLGLAGSINANSESGLVCAQAQHGSAPDIQGQNIANPTSLILSVAMMLAWIGERSNDDGCTRAGAAIDAATDAVLSDPACRTRDLGGSMNTDAFGERVAAAL
ncbi:MAG: isocitrate/isopropylmalate dehydrogenase family protein, partial [Pseudomonadota bacterium]